MEKCSSSKIVNNLKDVWDILEKKFDLMEEEDCYKLEEEFKQCKMIDQFGDSTDWFNQLDDGNTRKENIEGSKHTKTENDI